MLEKPQYMFAHLLAGLISISHSNGKSHINSAELNDLGYDVNSGDLHASQVEEDDGLD